MSSCLVCNRDGLRDPMILVSNVVLLFVFVRQPCTASEVRDVAVHRWMSNGLDDYDDQMVSGDKCVLNFLTFIL